MHSKYSERVKQVHKTEGLVAFWDFVNREKAPDGAGRFVSDIGTGESDYPLHPANLSKAYWHEGSTIGMACCSRGPLVKR